MSWRFTNVGKTIHRGSVEGQIEGGVSMGIGYALFEAMPRKDDRRWVDSFTEYLLPTAPDMPDRLDIQILEIPEADGPFGAKGLAEIATVPTAPAIANAVCDATKVRVRDLPIEPAQLLERIDRNTASRMTAGG